MGEEVQALGEVKLGHSCRQCGKVFSTGSALGGHMSSAHGAHKKIEYSSSMEGTMKNSQMGEFTCELCGKGFQSVKGLHGHMRLHPGRDRRGTTKPPTQSQVHEIINHTQHPPTVPIMIEEEGDSMMNLWSRTVTGKRGRRGTKPHLVDTPETYLAKKKALLSGDPRELKNIIDHHDPTGYFRRAFGNFLDSPWPEKKRDIAVKRDFDSTGNNYTRYENLATSSSDSPLLNLDVAHDSTSKDDHGTFEKSIAMEGTATSTENRLTGMESKMIMDSTM